MTSDVSLRAFASPPGAPLPVLVDLQQEHLAEPRLLKLSGADAAANHRKLLDYARRIGLPILFTGTLSEFVFVNFATLFIRWIEAFKRCHSEMSFDHDGPSCYPRASISADDFRRTVSTISGV